MGNYTRAYTPAAGEAADVDLTMAEFDALGNILNGNIETANIKDLNVTTAKLQASAVDSTKLANGAVRETHMDYSSANSGVEVWRTGPTHVGTAGGRIARVRKTGVTFTGDGPDSVTFTFATDCVDGDPAFSAAPVMMGQPIVTASDDPTEADAITHARVTTLDMTQAIIEIGHGYSTADVTIEFCVAGAV